MHFEIIIIGAGPAGLMAARELKDQSSRVLILEARDRIGGRAYTIDAGADSHIEAGAEFVHGSLPITLSLLKEARLGVTETGGRWVVVEEGETSEDLGTDDWPLLMKRLKELDDDMSLQNFLEAYFPEDKYAAVKSRAIGYAEGYDSADASKVSAKALGEEWSKPEEDEYRIDKGYGSLIDYMAGQCKAAGCEIMLQQVVSRISAGDEGVTVVTDKGSFTAERVIVALPLGVLQQEHAVQILPERAVYRKAIQELGIGDVIKFVFRFKTAFWEEQYEGVGFLLGRTEIPTWWTQAPTESSVLTGWLGGRGARAHAGLAEEQLLDAGLESLAVLFSIGKEELRQGLVASHVINWSADPFTMGSYAYTTVGAREAQGVLGEPMDGRVFFAGEYMFEGPEMGTVEAALWSGKEVAKKILAGK